MEEDAKQVKNGRVLVLAGGGAKGAYTFGVLKAFREANIAFDAVSGTSVGGLNALLWSANAMPEGNEIYANLSFRTVYPVANRFIAKLPTFLVRCIGVVYVFLRIVWGTAHGKPPADRRLELGVYASIASLTAIPIPLLGYSVRNNVLLSAALFAFFALVYFVAIRKRYSSAFALIPVSAVFGWFPVYLHFLAWLRPGKTNGDATMTTVAVGALTMIAAIAVGYMFLKWVFSDDMAVLKASALRDRLENILDNHRLSVPTYATLARTCYLHDPDNPHWYTNNVDAKGRPLPFSTWHPDTYGEWVPNYIHLNEVPADSVVEYALASAALPFGIVPPITIEGISHVDGGVVDNLPFYPFIERKEISEIYVVLLDHYKDDAAALKSLNVESIYSTNNRRIALSKFPRPKPIEIDRYLPSSPKLPKKKSTGERWTIPVVHPSYVPTFVPFYPSRDLGGNFFGGTLNFSSEYALDLMQLGYDDAMQKFRQ